MLCTPCYAWSQLHDYIPSPPYNAGTEHVGFSPTRHALLAPSVKRRGVLGESHIMRAASYNASGRGGGQVAKKPVKSVAQKPSVWRGATLA